MTNLIASAPTKEKLEDMINRFFYSEYWIITEDNRLYNTKLNRYGDNFLIVNKKGRWRFERKEEQK